MERGDLVEIFAQEKNCEICRWGDLVEIFASQAKFLGIFEEEG